MLRTLLNLVFPETCVGCGVAGNYVCESCLRRIHFEPMQRCVVCNKRSMFGQTHTRCRNTVEIDGVWAMAKYRGVLKKMIYTLKYSHASTLGLQLGELLWRNLPNSFKDFDAVHAVPLSSSRWRWRGYNQVADIADYLSKKAEMKHIMVLARDFAQPQAQIRSRDTRLKNMKNVFELKSVDFKLKGKKVILVDDICTTGATLRAATRPLKRAGASEVWGVVLAR